MKVYIFGNIDVNFDNAPLKLSERLMDDFPKITFEIIRPNQDLPFETNERIYMIDTVDGINGIREITEKHLDRFILGSKTSVHDFDLGFQLKYLKKIGKISQFTIIGIPMQGSYDYSSIHSIFKKLVAQDIQGS